MMNVVNFDDISHLESDDTATSYIDDLDVEYSDEMNDIDYGNAIHYNNEQLQEAMVIQQQKDYHNKNNNNNKNNNKHKSKQFQCLLCDTKVLSFDEIRNHYQNKHNLNNNNT